MARTSPLPVTRSCYTVYKRSEVGYNAFNGYNLVEDNSSWYKGYKGMKVGVNPPFHLRPKDLVFPIQIT